MGGHLSSGSTRPIDRPSGANGFPRFARIRSRSEYLRVQEGATSRIRTASLLVLVRVRAAGPGPGDTRLGVVASRRIGGAVVRNRAKRLIREAFRRCRVDLPPGLDLVVIANPSTARRALVELDREMSRVRRDLRRIFGDRPLAGRPALG